ncbi:MAG: acyltransferase [Deltaproteobacteria bacterium]|nr:acyltransferase [Deltaproteobacteria bacterium]
MKVGYIQSSPEFGEVTKNTDKVVRVLASKRMHGAKLVVLPELFSTGYQFKSKKEALSLSEEADKGYATRTLKEVAKDLDMHIVAGYVERSGKGKAAKVYNSASLIGPKGILGTYRKAHLFWNETNIFSPGNTPYKVFDIGGAKVGMMICFDWLFPEVTRTLALKGAEIIAHPSNLVLPHCPDAMITRCLENRVFAITANRVGSEKRASGKSLNFIGKSQVVSPKGRVLKRAGEKSTRAALVDIDVRAAQSKLITPMNHIFKDRRKELYKL